MPLVLAGYLLPSLVGAVLRIRDLGWSIAVNLVGGWTLLGWMVALWLALVYRQLDRLEGQMTQEPAR